MTFISIWFHFMINHSQWLLLEIDYYIKQKKTNLEIKHELDRRESDTQIDDP